jgi:iron(III) transport system substrate-binding protein
MKDQVMMAHPSSSGTTYTMLCTRLQMLGEEAGWDWMRQFAGNVLQYTKSGAAPGKFVGQGEAAVGVLFSHDVVAEIKNGSPLTLSFPEEGTGFEIGGMGIIEGAKNLENAKKWFDWALEPATQELGPKYDAFQAPTVKGATASKPELLQVNLIDYDFQWCGDHKKEFVDKFTNEIAGADSLKE